MSEKNGLEKKKKKNSMWMRIGELTYQKQENWRINV